MDIAASSARVVQWPVPSFFRASSSALAAEQAKECTLEFMDGRSVPAQLLALETGPDAAHVRLADGMQRIDLTQLRSIKLSKAMALAPDTAALKAIGAKVQERRAAEEKPFVVAFQDGKELRGSTLGFAKEKIGLFLFLTEPGSAPITRCFIPACQIKDLQIGPLLGDTLVGKQIVSGDTLTAALNKQKKLREERIGQYLTERAIISSEDLERALREQAKRPNVRLGDILVEADLITAEQLKEALAIQTMHRERRLGDILIEMGAVSVRLIQVALSDKLGIPYVNVREFRVEPLALEPIEAAFAIRHQVLPLLRTGESLVVAVENPLAAEFLQDLRFTSGMSIVPVIANPQDLKARILKEYSGVQARASDSKAAVEAGRNPRAAAKPLANLEELTSQLAKEAQPARADGDVSIDLRVSENTLVKLTNKIIFDAHAQGASDIHIESNAGKTNTRVRFRKDGDLEDYLDLPPAYSNALVSRLKVMAGLDISEHRHPQDGKIDFGKHSPLPIELRMAVIPTANNLEDVVLRILANSEALPLDQVGFSERDLAALKKMISRTYGLVLVCGPTGSGKTTTLHSVLRDINRTDMKIWTAEDPIEITQPGLRQVQVQPKIGWTFANAMRAFLRADPDVIMVGEMRDAETTKIGIEASLTGHLVFSTLHTNSAAESIVRLLDLGMDPFNFADALIGVVSQRLARKLCPQCKQARVASAEEIEDLVGEYCNESGFEQAAVLEQWRNQYATDGHFVLHEAAGCENCREGYKGRVVVYELLPGTASVKHLVRTRAAVPELLAAGQQSGMRTLRQDAIEKVLQGVLDLSSARAVSS